MMNMKVVTLNGAVQQLHTALGVLAQNDMVIWLSLQPGSANANPVYVGSTDATTSSNYFVRLEAAAATVPPAPWQISEAMPNQSVTSLSLRLEDLFVIGTNAEKLHVGWISI